MGIAPTIGGRGGAATGELVTKAKGLVVEAFSLAGSNPAATAPGTTTATSTVAGTLVGIRAGTTLTNLVRFCVAAGASVTLSKMALFDKTGVLLAVTGDGHATLGASTYHIVPIAKDGAGNTITSYTVQGDDAFYIACLDLASGGTAPTFARSASLAAVGAQIGSGARAAMIVATQSDITGNVTPANSAAAFWFGAS